MQYSEAKINFLSILFPAPAYHDSDSNGMDKTTTESIVFAVTACTKNQHTLLMILCKQNSQMSLVSFFQTSRQCRQSANLRVYISATKPGAGCVTRPSALSCPGLCVTVPTLSAVNETGTRV